MLCDLTFDKIRARIQSEFDNDPDFLNLIPFRLQQGVYLANGWNLSHLTDQKTREVGDIRIDHSLPLSEKLALVSQPLFPESLHRKFPVKPHEDEWETVSHLPSSGVCDTPEQLLGLYDFEADPRKLWISFVELRKEFQPARDGWRWHKWGKYIGEQNPQYEYLADEPDIERIHTFCVYTLLD